MKEEKNLIEGLQEEIQRVRDMIPGYESLPKNAGLFAITMMKSDITKAEKAISEGNTVDMIVLLKALKEYNY